MGDQILSLHLETAAKLAAARVAAIYVPQDDGSIRPLESWQITQRSIDDVQDAWTGLPRLALEKGQLTRLGTAVIWPLCFQRRLVALVYLDNAQPRFPEPHQELHGHLLADRVMHLAPPKPVGPYLARASENHGLRWQLEVVLHQTAGNVSAAARLLGIDRDTIYERVIKYGVNLADFRPPKG